MDKLFANSEDPDQTPCSVVSDLGDQTPRSVVSDLGLHRLPITLLGLMLSILS